MEFTPDRLFFFAQKQPACGKKIIFFSTGILKVFISLTIYIMKP